MACASRPIGYIRVRLMVRFSVRVRVRLRVRVSFTLRVRVRVTVKRWSARREQGLWLELELGDAAIRKAWG